MVNYFSALYYSEYIEGALCRKEVLLYQGEID